jgi:lipoprotein-anchoring transpeptidase ErfK/SrfK
MNKFKGSPVYFAFMLALMCVVLGVVAWTATSSTALSLEPIPTSAQVFGYAAIAKPTATATPTALPAAIPIPTQTPEPAAYVQVLENTPAPNDAAPPNYSGNKYILVDISEQHMYVYENEALLYSFVSSTGMNNSTRVGTFSVLEKIPNAYGATWDIWMPNWLGIYWSGSLQNGIHALPILSNGATLWSGYLGVPISYGCIVLDTYDAQLLYDWAEIGTPVEIQW